MYLCTIALALLPQRESPSNVFIPLYKYVDNPAIFVCYDNACNVKKYFDGREMIFAKNMIFNIDVLHGFNHINCAKCKFIYIYTYIYIYTLIHIYIYVIYIYIYI